MKIIFDNNIWISFLIGKRMKALQSFFGNPAVTIVYCDELEQEYLLVARRPKIAKYADDEQVERIHRLMTQYCLHDVALSQTEITNRDPNDIYLLTLAEHSNADYLVSGDSDLTDMKEFHNTRIVSFQQMIEILQNNNETNK